MDKIKKQALEAAGWKFGDAEDFLNEGRAMNESKPTSGWNEAKPSFPIAMNAGEAMAYASKNKCFWTGEMHTALETLAAEVERLRAELAAAKDQFVNDCIKHVNRVGLLNDCEFESGMIADSIQEYFGDNQ